MSPIVYVVGVVVGSFMSFTLSLLYHGQSSFVGVDIADLLATTPYPILLASPVLGLLIAVVTRRLRFEQIAVTGGFLVGLGLGVLAGLLLFALSPFAGHGLLSHLAGGFFVGGGIGSMTPFITYRIGERQ